MKKIYKFIAALMLISTGLPLSVSAADENDSPIDSLRPYDLDEVVEDAE